MGFYGFIKSASIIIKSCLSCRLERMETLGIICELVIHVLLVSFLMLFPDGRVLLHAFCDGGGISYYTVGLQRNYRHHILLGYNESTHIIF